MAFLRGLFLVSVVFYLMALVVGYKFDPQGSCDSRKGDLKKMLDRAKEMAKAGEAAMRKSPLDPDVNNLRKMLFSTMTANDLIANQLGLVYKSIQRNDDDANKDDKRSPVIYCNFDRWNEIPGAKAGEVFWKDKYSTDVFRDSQAIQKCKDGRAKAFLVGWNSAQGARPESQDFIQLCPWWVEKSLSVNYRQLEQIPDKRIKQIPIGPPANGQPWMDLIMAFEVTLMHEFSHSYDGAMTTSRGGYGWKSIIVLKNNALTPPYANADALAYFNLGVNLIMKKGQAITGDGILKQICTKENRFSDKCRTQ